MSHDPGPGGPTPAELRALQRVRGRLRRERAALEEEAHEGGELNLTPYLDILINTIIFLLATTAVAVPLSQISVGGPRYVDPDDPATAAGAPHPAEEGRLTVAISRSGFVVGGPGGVLRGPGGALPTVACAGALRGGRCPVYLAGGSAGRWVDRYDYAALRRLARRIKAQNPSWRRAVITADREIPYRVLVRTMDTLRGERSARCSGGDGCLFDRVGLASGVM